MTSLDNSLPEETIMEYLKSGFPDNRIAWPNKSFTPKETENWLRASFLPVPPERIGFDESDKHSGIFQVDVTVPSQKGILPAVTISRAVEKLFNKIVLTTEDGVKLRFIDPPKTNPHRQDANWYIIPVSITYTIYY
jgi:hypothetical protein